MVVAHHATIMLYERNGLAVGNWINGGSGVDLFFVISGFVMTLSSAPLQKTAHPARTFFARRIERIVPMYWLATGLKVITVLALPRLALHALGTPWHVISCFLFIPSLNPVGGYDPILVVGWTLNFEMAFYVLFAATLAMRASLLKVLGPVLVLIWLLPLLVPKLPAVVGWYSSPLVLEFLFGIVLAKLLKFVERIPQVVAVLLVLGGFWPLLFWVWPNFGNRLGWGLPALAVVAGAVALERHWGRKSPRWMLELGDASYSIYLVHGFALPVVGVMLANLNGNYWGTVPLSMCAMVVLSTLTGELVYRVVERPITNWFKGRRKTAVPAIA